MAQYKLCIADPQKGKTYQKEVKDAEAKAFTGLNIKEKVKGDSFGLAGFEFEITGGSDKYGFPMRSGIMGVRKKITLEGGVGFSKGAGGGQRRAKTICGHKIGENTAQINLKVIQSAGNGLAAALGIEEKAEEPKADAEPKGSANADDKAKAGADAAGKGAEKKEAIKPEAENKPEADNIPGEKKPDEKKPAETKPVDDKKAEESKKD